MDAPLGCADLKIPNILPYETPFNGAKMAQTQKVCTLMVQINNFLVHQGWEWLAGKPAAGGRSSTHA
jgi:hypothetical protein